MEPPFLAIELRKLLLWLTLECFRRKFVRKQIDWTGRVGSLSQKRSKWAWLLKFRAQDCATTPLLEILDPPLEKAKSASLAKLACMGACVIAADSSWL